MTLLEVIYQTSHSSLRGYRRLCTTFHICSIQPPTLETNKQKSFMWNQQTCFNFVRTGKKSVGFISTWGGHINFIILHHFVYGEKIFLDEKENTELMRNIIHWNCQECSLFFYLGWKCTCCKYGGGPDLSNTKTPNTPKHPKSIPKETNIVFM